MSTLVALTDTTPDTESTESSRMMTIRVLYFAGLADEANCHEEKIQMPESTSLTEIYRQVSKKHNLSHHQSNLRVAVNDYFAKWTDELTDGDSVAFITPVAGG